MQSVLFLIILMAGSSAVLSREAVLPENNPVLRFLTINVWSGLDYRGYVRMGEYETAAIREKRYQALLRQIRQIAPDVIALQEANPLPAYAQRLAAALGYEVFWHIGVSGVRVGSLGLPCNLREGDVLLVHPKWRPRFAGRRQLSGGYVGNRFSFHFDDATQILAVRIQVNEQPVWIFVTHWHASLPDAADVRVQLDRMQRSGEISMAQYQRAVEKIREGVRWRTTEARMTRNFIREVAGGDPFVLLGDLNALPGSSELSPIHAMGAVDTYAHLHPDSSGATWDARKNRNIQLHYQTQAPPTGDVYQRLWQTHAGTSRRIDYIFFGPAQWLASQQVQILRSEVVLNQITGGIHPSDHFGVLTELRFTGRHEVGQKENSKTSKGQQAP